MSLVKSLLRRSLGKNRTCNELSTRMLEEFQCHMTDEHPIIDDEAGAMWRFRVTMSEQRPLARSRRRFTGIVGQSVVNMEVGGYTQMLALADENGCVIMYNTLKTGIQAAIAEWLTHKNAVFDLTWLRREQKLLTASGDQTVVLWDASTTDKLEVFKGHTSSVKSVCMGLDNDAVFATGSRDGHIMIWDRRCNKKDQRIPPVNVIKNAHCLPPQSASKSRKKSKLGPALDSQQSVTNVLFQDSNHLVSVGAVDGVIKVWDLRKNYTSVSTDPVPKYSLLYAGFSSRRHGFTSLTFDSSHSQLFASCTDDIIYQYDFINYNQNPVHCYKGHQNSTFYVKTSVSPDDQYITSGSSDQLAYIWKVGFPQESVVTLSGHTAEVTSVAWSPDDMAKIASLSDDNTMRVWRSTKSLGIPGSIVGSAQRVSKEVGVSTASLSVIASPLLRRPGDISHPHTPPSQKRPVAPKTPSSSAVSNGLSARKVSQLVPQTPPSIKHWFTPSRNKDEENKAVTQSPVTTGRTPVCKRKLINVDSDGTTNGPRKRVCRQTLRDISLQNNVDKDNHIPTEQSEQGEIRKEENEELKTEQFTTGPDAISARLGFDAMASPIRKVSTSDAAQTSSPTANLPNLVYGIGVVTPPKPASPACLRKGRSNWLTQLRQKQTERPTLLLSPRSTGHTSQDTEDSDCNILSPTKLKSPLPGSKSILSYFGRRIDRL